MMQAVRTSETSVYFNETKWYYIPDSWKKAYTVRNGSPLSGTMMHFSKYCYINNIDETSF
jgi:hypothetical protein